MDAAVAVVMCDFGIAVLQLLRFLSVFSFFYF